MARVGTASVVITADLSRLAGQLERDLNRVLREVDINIDPVSNNIVAGLSRAGREAAGAFEDALEDGLGDELEPIENILEDTADEAELAAREMEREFERASREIQRAFREAQREADQQFEQIERAARAAARAVTRAFSVAVLVGAAAVALGALAAAANAATTGVIGLIGALAPAVGIFAALPAVIGAGAAAVGTLRVALIGVEDAFTAALTGDAQEFAEAIEDLSPSAQAAARALRELREPLSELQQDVQEAFFADLADDIEDLGGLLPTVRDGMVDIASASNNVVQELLAVVTAGDNLSGFESIFATTADIIAELAEPLGVLAQGLLDVAIAGTDALGGLNDGISEAITNLGEWLTESAEAGDVNRWIDNAITVFQQLGAIIGDVVGILRSLFSAVETSGGNALGTLGSLLDTANEFLATGEGQSALVEIFQGLAEVGEAVGPVFQALVTGLGRIAPLVGDIAIALGPALATTVDRLADGLTQIDFGTVAEGLADVLDVASNILPILGSLLGVLDGPLGDALTGVADAFEPVIESIDEILSSGGLDQLSAAFETLGDIAVQIAEIFAGQTIRQIEGLLPPILALLDPVFGLIEALLPLVDLLLTLASVLGPLNPLALALLVPLAQLTARIVEFATFILNLVNPAIIALTNLIRGSLIAAGEELRDILTGVLNRLGGAWSSFSSGVASAVGSIVSYIRGLRSDAQGVLNDLVGFVRGLPGEISSAASGMWDGIWEAFRSAINRIIDGWNSLEFTLPSIDTNIPGVGTIGGGSFGTPNISRLQEGGLTLDGGLAQLHPTEAVLPLEDQRTVDLLSNALSQAMRQGRIGSDGAALDPANINVRVYVGDQEIRDITRVEIDNVNRDLTRSARAGSGAAL